MRGGVGVDVSQGRLAASAQLGLSLARPTDRSGRKGVACQRASPPEHSRAGPPASGVRRDAARCDQDACDRSHQGGSKSSRRLARQGLSRKRVNNILAARGRAAGKGAQGSAALRLLTFEELSRPVEPEERAGAKRSAHRSAQGGSEGHQAPEIGAGALPPGRLAADSVSDRGGSEVWLQTRGASEHRLPRAEAHLLLSPRDAGRGAEGDSGAGRAQHAHDDAQVHSPGAERAHKTVAA